MTKAKVKLCKIAAQLLYGPMLVFFSNFPPLNREINCKLYLRRQWEGSSQFWCVLWHTLTLVCDRYSQVSHLHAALYMYTHYCEQWVWYSQCELDREPCTIVSCRVTCGGFWQKVPSQQSGITNSVRCGREGQSCEICWCDFRLGRLNLIRRTWTPAHFPVVEDSWEQWIDWGCPAGPDYSLTGCSAVQPATLPSRSGPSRAAPPRPYSGCAGGRRGAAAWRDSQASSCRTTNTGGRASYTGQPLHNSLSEKSHSQNILIQKYSILNNNQIFVYITKH